jgi:hypothetical protein
MERTDQDFKDGLALDLFSPKNRTLVVKQNTSPLPTQFITGTTGGPFVALSNYSYIIQMNETANDLIAKIDVPYEPDEVSQGSAVTQCALPLIKTIKLDSAGSYITLSLLCGVFHISLIGDNTVS